MGQVLIRFATRRLRAYVPGGFINRFVLLPRRSIAVDHQRLE